MFTSKLSQLRSGLVVPESLFPKFIECCAMMTDSTGPVNLCTGPNKIPKSLWTENDERTDVGCCNAPWGSWAVLVLVRVIDLIVVVACVATMSSSVISVRFDMP